MKRTMFVTVADFIANGGELKKGREIYDLSPRYNVRGTYDRYDSKMESHYIEQIGFGKLPLYLDTNFVKIEVTPIWV
jgi:hypothetical protein